MNPLPQYIYLLLILFAGFLISGAFSPSISEVSIGSNDGLKNFLPPPPPPPPPPSSPPPPSPLPPLPSPLSLIPGSAIDLSVPSPSARKLLCSDDNKYDMFFLAWSDGTIYLMDGQSMVPRWKLATGSPILQSKRADPDMEYFIDFGDNGRLYEYSKAFGRRELNSTLEELVHEASVIENSFTFGSKETTLHFLNETTGEVFSRHHLPATRTKAGMPLVEEKLVASSGADGYIMLVMTDYSLSSITLPTDPSQITPDANEPLWKISRSHIRALYIKNGQPSNVGDNLVLSSPSQIDIPVYVLPMSSNVRGAIDEDLMLPSPSFAQYRNQETLMLPIASGSMKNVSETLHSPSRDDKILGLPYDEHSYFDSSNNLSEASKYLLGYSDADKLNVRERSCEHESLQFQSGEECSNNNLSRAPLNLNKDANSHLVGNDYAVKKSSSDTLTGVTYGNFAWIAIPFFLVILALWFVKFRVLVKNDEQLNNLEEKQSVTPKKRKARKAGNTKNGAIVSNPEKVTSSGKDTAETNGHEHAQKYWLQCFDSSLDAGNGRRIGKLFISNSEIGRGSNGTVVFEGVYEGRPVAVKRLLHTHHDVAIKEIQHLIASDKHQNIVRLHGVEEDVDFVYISLERCFCSLTDLIQPQSESSMPPAFSGNQTSRSTNENKVSLYYEKGIRKDPELWRANGFPSPQLLKLMRDMVAGLAHLHELGIIHRDLKPHNVLVSTDADGSLCVKLSDMGISKQLLEDMSSFSHHATGGGSSGWQAPEQLLHGRQTRAVDLFSLGCVFFFCITKGKHPFGNHFERDSNIINDRIDLFLVDHVPEAVDLLSRLLAFNPNMRPNAAEVLHHPFFWNSEMRLTFLRDTSDRIELEDRENESELLKALENVAPVAFGGKWGEKLDSAFITDMGRYRKYNFECTRDLLRVIRNKLNHYRELPEELQVILGAVPEGFDRYFSSRFPKLLIEVYKVVHRYCSGEDGFSKYFKSSLLLL